MTTTAPRTTQAKSPSKGVAPALVAKATTRTPRRRFPVDDVPEGLLKDISDLRARLEVETPDEINTKVFLLSALQEMLTESYFEAPAHLLRVLQAIKEDYMAFLPEEEVK